MMSYQTEAHSNSAPSERTRRSEAALARTWNEYYALHGRIWGPDPSRTALELDRALRSVVQTLPGRRLVCDLGCGYGRDSIFLAGRGYDCIGVDVAETGLQFGQAQYETASDRFGRAVRVSCAGPARSSRSGRDRSVTSIRRGCIGSNGGSRRNIMRVPARS